MKKIFAAVMALVILSLNVTGCGKKFKENKYLQEKTVEMTEFLTDLASDENYIRAINNNEFFLECCDDWSRADIDKSEDIVILEGDQLELILNLTYSNKLDHFSDVVQDNLSSMFCLGAPNMLNATNGVDILSATTTMKYSRTYVPDGDVDNQVWLIQTNRDDVFFCLVFVNTGDDVIYATVSYVIAPNGMSKLIKDTFGTSVKFSEIEWAD